MKRYSLIVALHIIGIAFLSVGVYLLVDAGLWFSALMAFLILLAIAVHLYRLQMMQVRMMRHLAESLRYDDMMLSFRSPYKNRSMEDMVDELSEAMRNFRTRVLERNEMEAWQKLIRVLTHEIMNSITPIISLSETLSEREMSEKNYPVMRQGMQTIHRRSKGLLEFVENYRKLTRLPAPVRRPVAVREPAGPHRGPHRDSYAGRGHRLLWRIDGISARLAAYPNHFAVACRLFKHGAAGPNQSGRGRCLHRSAAPTAGQ